MMTEPDRVSVEDRLRAYGDVLEQQVGGAQPADPAAHYPTSGWKRGLAVAAAAAVVVVGGLGLTWSLGRVDVNTTASEAPGDTNASEPGLPTAPDPDTFPGVDACISFVADLQDGTRQGLHPDISGLFDPRTETEDVVVLALQESPPIFRLLLLGEDAMFSCRTNKDGQGVHGVGSSPVEAFEPGDTEGIKLLDQWDSGVTDSPSVTPELMTGPGEVEAIGRIGAEVEAVWVELADGTSQSALIHDDRWFTLEGEVPPDVLVFDKRYHWRLNDGTVHSAPPELIDEETEAERCAATPGCVEDRLAELQAIASAEGLDQQAEALADGRLDDDELRVAASAMVDCLAEAGIDAQLSTDGTRYGISQGRTPGMSSEDGGSPQDILVVEDCGHQFHDLVDELRALREAEALLAEE